MEGSVRRATDGVRITVQLLDGHDGSHVWAESYDTPLDVAKIFVRTAVTNYTTERNA